MANSKYTTLEDSELVSRCLEGDSGAWEALILRYRRLIYSIPVKFHFSPADCADVFQGVCVKLIEHLHNLKDESKVSSWLITTTTRQCIHFRSLKTRESSTEDGYTEPADPGEDIEKLRIQTEQQHSVREAVEQLPERCKRLIELLYFTPSSPTYEEVSQLMKIPVPSIGPTRARCFEKLRIVLRRKGIMI